MRQIWQFVSVGGLLGGAESRGFDRGTWDGSELSAVAWIWWGNDPKTVEKIDYKKARVALLAALSDYRPPPELAALAKKEVPLPFELKASHPAYYTYHADNRFWETFYITDNYSLGTLLVPHRSYQVKGTINAQYATYKLVIRAPVPMAFPRGVRDSLPPLKKEVQEDSVTPFPREVRGDSLPPLKKEVKGHYVPPLKSLKRVKVDSQSVNNAVVSLGGTYHSLMADGNSPGDQLLQEKGAVIYQLRLNEDDIAAGVPAVSHLVLPSRYGQPG